MKKSQLRKIIKEALDASTPAPNNIPGGLSQFATIGDLATMHKLPLGQIIRQIMKGVKVESEHTTDLDIAMEIAFDHIYEDPKYYDKLSGIEERVNRQPSTDNLKEMTSSELDTVERHADTELDPIDIQFGNHFFDRLNDPRNGKEITAGELISFFDRLAKKKEAFMSFVKRYQEFVVKDKNSSINIPFVSQVNQALAKTIMRKPGFMTPDPTIALQENFIKKQ